MEIRIVDDLHMQDAYYLSAQAFRGGARDDHFAENRLKDTNRPKSTLFGVYDEAGLQAKVAVIDYQQIFGRQFTAPMGGIGGVVCLPASRGKGYAATGVKHALEYMRERGQYLSALFPFSWEFYRNLGWEWVGVQREYTVTTRIMSTVPETENVRATVLADRPAIAKIYSAFAGRYRGMAVRDDKMWNRLLNDGDKNYTYTYLYESPEGPGGYITFQSGSKESTDIHEFVSLTPQAQRALLGLLHRHEMQIKAFKWWAPEDDTLWSNLCHWDVATRVEPVVQARIVDLSQAFQALKPAADITGSVVLAVNDDAAPWNTGTWCISASSGAVEVKAASADSDIECDIQAITQAFHGVPNLESIRSADRLRVHNEAGYDLLNRLLSGPPVWLNDHF